MIDYKGIVDNLNKEKIKELLIKLGVNNIIEKNDCFITNTICHNANVDGASEKLYYYFNNHIFYCYTECGAMSIFKFLEHYYDAREIEYNWYNDILNVAKACANYEENLEIFTTKTYESIIDYYKELNIIELPIYNDSVLDSFIKFYPVEWLNDNITKETMDKFNIKFSIGQNKIIIPHYNAENKLIGIRGRALNQWEVENIGKYMPVQIENKWYSHPLSLNLYGLNQTKNNINNVGVCFIFESEKAILQMENFNMPNCSAAICGSKLNKFQLKILLKYCNPQEIILCLDNEELKGKDIYFNKLMHMCKQYNKYCNFSFVYDRFGLTKLKDSPTDNGEDIFRKLIESRVKVK